MMTLALPLRVLVTLFALYQARDLFLAWRDAPFERMSFLVFGLWCAPVFFFRDRRPRAGGNVPLFLWAAAALFVLKSLAGLNLAAYIGLALVLAGYIAPEFYSRSRIAPFVVWIASALLWMPVVGWIFSSIGPGTLSVLRILAVATVDMALFATTRIKRQTAVPGGVL